MIDAKLVFASPDVSIAAGAFQTGATWAMGSDRTGNTLNRLAADGPTGFLDCRRSPGVFLESSCQPRPKGARIFAGVSAVHVHLHLRVTTCACVVRSGLSQSLH